MRRATGYEDANGTEIYEGDLLAEENDLFGVIAKWRVFWQRGYEQWYVEQLDEDNPYIAPLYAIADECIIAGRSD